MLKDTLLKLLTIPGPSGFEGACADYIESEMRPCADEIRRDVMGNLVCVKKGAPGGKRILLTAHMDEIGFIVTAIDEDGFLRVATVGGVNPKITQASHVVLASGAQGVLFAEAGSDPDLPVHRRGRFLARGGREEGADRRLGRRARRRQRHGRPPGRALHGRPLRLRGPDGDDAPPGQDGQRDRRGLHHPGGGRPARRDHRGLRRRSGHGHRPGRHPRQRLPPHKGDDPRRQPPGQGRGRQDHGPRAHRPSGRGGGPRGRGRKGPACPASARSCWAAPRTPRPSTSPARACPPASSPCPAATFTPPARWWT